MGLDYRQAGCGLLHLHRALSLR